MKLWPKLGNGLVEANQNSRAIIQVAEAIRTTTTMADTAKAALDSTKAAFGWAYASYWAVDPSEKVLKFVIDSGSVNDEFNRVTLAAKFREGEGLSGRAWKNRDLFFTPDLSQMSDCCRAPVAQRAGVKSGVCFPIQVEGVVVGTMDFFAMETLHPSKERLETLRGIGNLVSASLTRIRQTELQTEAAADSKAISRVLEVLAQATSAQEAARQALDVVKDAFGWAYGSYWAIDPAEKALKFVVESGMVNEEFRRVTMAAKFREGEGLSGRAWRSRDLFFTPDISLMSDCCRAPVAHRAGVKSGVCFPIIIQGQVAGTMDFFATKTLQPTQERLDALRAIGNLVSTNLSRIEIAERQVREAHELRTKIDTILEVVSEASRGDLTQHISWAGDDLIGKVAGALNQCFQELRSSFGRIAENANSLGSASEQLSTVSHTMSSNSEETSAQATVVSAAAEQVSRNVQTVAAGVEEMSASIREIAKNAGDSARVANAAVRVTETTNATISKLGESSAEIGQVIKVITSIAQQTNLLALNATIEAARAGEAGKGFAVVANEVKELAKETAKATEDISQKIEAIQRDTKGAIEAINEISKIINQINDISNTIATAVEEQTATTNEISRNISEAAKGSSEIAHNITSVAESAQGTTHGATEIQQAGTGLARMAVELQELLAQFKYQEAVLTQQAPPARARAPRREEAVVPRNGHRRFAPELAH